MESGEVDNLSKLVRNGNQRPNVRTVVYGYVNTLTE